MTLVPTRLPTRVPKTMRRDLRQLDSELDSVKMEIAKMQNVQISNMMNRELRLYAQNIKDDAADARMKQLKMTEVVLEFKYFYFWTYQGYFFGLVESANQIKENCNKYALTVVNDLQGPKEHLEYRVNKEDKKKIKRFLPRLYQKSFSKIISKLLS